MPGGSSAGTATLVTTLPYTDSDTTLTTAGLWYKYIATSPAALPLVLGVFAYSVADLSLSIFSPDGVTPYPPGTDAISFLHNKPCQIPVDAGVAYYFNVHGGAATGAYTFSIQAAPDLAAPAGSILINDDTPGWPLVLLSATTGAPLRFVHPFPAGEHADVLAAGPHAGRILVHDALTGHLKLYAPDLTLLADLPYGSPGTVSVVRCPVRTNKAQTGQFFVGNPVDPAHPTVTTVTSAGVFGPTTWTLPTGGLIGIAPNKAGTVLYYTQGGAVKRWDLVGNVGLTDLAAAIPNYGTQDDILVLDDDTILVSYESTTPSTAPQVMRYQTDGTVLNTYTRTGTRSSDQRLACAIDDPASFWVWNKLSTGVSRFANLKVSDGSVLTTFDVAQFENGVYAPAETPTPSARFGHSESCPFLIIRTTIQPDVVYQECPCPDDPWPLSTMRDQIGARLHDPGHIRWTTGELNRIVWEALRTWNAFTGWASGRATVTLTPGVAFYQLNDLVPALRAPYVSDNELYAGINDKLLETVANTPQFSQDFLTKSYGRRHQNVLVESGVVLVRRLETINVVSSDGRYPLDPCILAVRRMAWSENGDASTIPLYRDDQWGEDRYAHRFPQTPTRRPRVWSMSTRPPQYLQLVPIPTHTGTLDFICIIDCTPVPPDWTWVAPFGVLADLLGQSGPGQDLERARYAEARYRHGLEAMKTGSVVQSVRVENRLVPVHATPDLDQYKRRWQTQTGLPREAVTFGQTILGFSPVPDQAYSVTLDLTQIAPLPLNDADLVFLPPAARDPVLDYAEHLALFKEGPGPLAESMVLLERFFTAAGVRLSLDQALIPSRGSLWSQASHDQRSASPHHLKPEPALVSGVGSQPVFPNPEAP